MSTIRSYLTTGSNDGLWNGPGIDSSAAAISNGKYALGSADGADNVVTGLSSSSIEIKYALYGDANLDGVVAGSDFTIVVSNLSRAVNGWDQGDFYYQGVVDGSDFTAIVSNLGSQSNAPSVVSLAPNSITLNDAKSSAILQATSNTASSHNPTHKPPRMNRH
jgi:hypothetical protein